MAQQPMDQSVMVPPLDISASMVAQPLIPIEGQPLTMQKPGTVAQPESLPP